MKYRCHPTIDNCADLPCKGHRVTKAIEQAARVLAWADGWDSLEEAEQDSDYYAAAAQALREIKAAGA